MTLGGTAQSVNARSDAARLVGLLTFVIAIAVLGLARDLLIPVALAVLVAFILSPVVMQLQRIGLPRALAVVVAMSGAVAVVVSVTAVVAIQFVELAGQLPEYRGTIRSKLDRISGDADGWLGRARSGLDALEDEVREATAEDDDGDAASSEPGVSWDASTTPGPLRPGDPSLELGPLAEPRRPSVEPIPVVLVEGDSSTPIGAASELAAPLLAPLLGALIVIMVATFFLVRRDDLRDRLAALAGRDRLRITTQVLEEASRGISHYLVGQLIVNCIFGLLVGVVLALVGVPNAILFGAIAVPLRFAPVIGPWIVVALPTLLAAVVFDDWTTPLLTLGLLVAVELIVTYVIEPLILGAKTGLSTPAIILALLFWTWLWGAAGLLLAIPLTVCLAVLGRHVPRFQWLAIALDNAPALSPPLRFYQRILALDADDALAIARDARIRSGLIDVCEEFIGPALRLLESDRHSQTGLVAPGDPHLVVMREVTEALIDDEPVEADRVTAPGGVLREGVAPASPSAVCVPARDEADAIMASLLARVLRLRGVHSATTGLSPLATERADTAREAGTDVICVCAVPPMAEARARQVIRRIHGSAERSGVELSSAVVVLLWTGEVADAAAVRLASSGAAAAETLFEPAIRAITAAANGVSARRKPEPQTATL